MREVSYMDSPVLAGGWQAYLPSAWSNAAGRCFERSCAYAQPKSKPKRPAKFHAIVKLEAALPTSAFHTAPGNDI